jgi:hypothetical protein
MRMTIEDVGGKRIEVLPNVEDADPAYIGQQGYIVDVSIEDEILLYRVTFESLVDEYFSVDEIKFVEE